jgi:hypothetical protein
MKLANKRIKLSWGKLLGFNQVKVPHGELRSRAVKGMIGRKIGAKAGIKKQP